MNTFIMAVVFFVGLICGSFLNSVIYRMRELVSIFSERSHCPHCKEEIKWYDLLPLFSFVALSGKCRRCKNKISWQYPLVELGTALLFLMIYLNFGLSTYSVAIMLVSLFLVVIFVYDMYHQIIPDLMIMPAIFIWIVIWLGMLIFHYSLGASFVNLLIGALVGGGFIALLVLITKGKGMGVGDIKLALLLGFILGWQYTVVALSCAFILGASIGILLVISKVKKMKSSVPFGPFLIAGFYFALFYGEKVINWYLG